jgi:hypothetical protein
MKPQGYWNPMSWCCCEGPRDQHHGAIQAGGLDAEKYPRRLRAGGKNVSSHPFYMAFRRVIRTTFGLPITASPSFRAATADPSMRYWCTPLSKRPHRARAGRLSPWDPAPTVSNAGVCSTHHPKVDPS